MKTIVRYVASDGKEPFTKWCSVPNLIKIDRMAQGNVANVEPVGEGVHELKINIGPGFRVCAPCRRCS